MRSAALLWHWRCWTKAALLGTAITAAKSQDQWLDSLAWFYAGYGLSSDAID